MYLIQYYESNCLPTGRCCLKEGAGVIPWVHKFVYLGNNPKFRYVESDVPVGEIVNFEDIE